MVLRNNLPSHDCFVTVIMPVFNTEKFLSEAIESVLKQTHQKFSFIIIDDGSTDSSASIIESFAAKDSRIRLIRQQNLGHAESMNRALQLSSTDWAFRLDSDDVMLPHRIEKQISFIQSQPEITIASCRANYIDDKGRIFGATANDLKTVSDLRKLVRRGDAVGLLQPGVVMRRDRVMAIGGYRGQFWPADDIDLWTRLAEQGRLILIQDEILMKYRIHRTSIITSNFMNSRKQYEWVRACIDARRNHHSEPDINEFSHIWNSVSRWQRVNRWRKTFAKYMYRSAGQDFLYRKYAAGIVRYLLASACQPSYALLRAWEQTQRRSRRQSIV